MIGVGRKGCMPYRSSSAGGAGEEDHARRAARDLLERRDHLGLPAPRLRRQRDGGPHALLELAPELLDEALLVLGDLDVSLGDQLLAVARAHAEELHRRDYVTGARSGSPVER